MKKIVILVICITAALAAFAQNDSLKTETLYKADVNGAGELGISRGGSRGTAVFSLLGYDITFAGRSLAENPSKVKLSVGLNRGEFGFNLLSKPDYSRYDADQKGFLDIDTWRSWHVGISLIDIRIALNERRTIFFNAGTALVLDTYFFKNKLILDNVDGKIVPAPLQGKQRNGQLMTTALSIPVRLDFVVWKKLMVSGYVSMDLVGGTSRFRNRTTTIELPGVRPVTMSLGAMLTYDGVGFYVRYGVVPMFRNSAELVTRPLSFGVTFGF